MTPTRTPERLGTVSLDFARRDDPRLADENGAQAAVADLITQSGGRHSEERARHCQGHEERAPGSFTLRCHRFWPFGHLVQGVRASNLVHTEQVVKRVVHIRRAIA